MEGGLSLLKASPAAPETGAWRCMSSMPDAASRRAKKSRDGSREQQRIERNKKCKKNFYDNSGVEEEGKEEEEGGWSVFGSWKAHRADRRLDFWLLDAQEALACDSSATIQDLHAIF